MRLLPYLLTPLLAVFFVVPAASAKDISDQELHAVWGRGSANALISG